MITFFRGKKYICQPACTTCSQKPDDARSHTTCWVMSSEHLFWAQLRAGTRHLPKSDLDPGLRDQG